MAITNRDLDASEQLRAFSISLGRKAAPNITSATLVLGTVPFNSELRAMSVVGFGLSGAPQVELRVQRFIAGSGHTIMAPGVTVVVPEMGVSGPISASLPAQGHSLLQLLAGDQLIMLTGAANTSSDSLTVGWVLKALQDIKSSYGNQS